MVHWARWHFYADFPENLLHSFNLDQCSTKHTYFEKVKYEGAQKAAKPTFIELGMGVSQEMRGCVN